MHSFRRIYGTHGVYIQRFCYIPVLISPSINLALEHARARGSVCLLSAVEVVCDSRVRSLVCARKADCGRRLARAAGDDVDLGALHVELGAGVAARRVQRNQLSTEQVLAGRNAGRNRDGLLALVGDQAVDTPFGAVERVFGDLVQSVLFIMAYELTLLLTLNHPLPTPESVFASETFFM